MTAGSFVELDAAARRTGLAATGRDLALLCNRSGITVRAGRVDLAAFAGQKVELGVPDDLAVVATGTF